MQETIEKLKAVSAELAKLARNGEASVNIYAETYPGKIDPKIKFYIRIGSIMDSPVCDALGETLEAATAKIKAKIPGYNQQLSSDRIESLRAEADKLGYVIEPKPRVEETAVETAV